LDRPLEAGDDPEGTVGASLFTAHGRQSKAPTHGVCSCAFLRKADGRMPHFFSVSRSLPLRCQSAMVLAMNCPHGPSRSSSRTAPPHGSVRMVSSGISKAPFRIAKPLLEGGVVVKPAYAVALLQRGLSFVLSPEGDDVGAVLFRHIFVVKGTLDATDLLV